MYKSLSMPDTDRRVHRSKQALKASLLEWMSRKPFESITITDIVKLADVNRSTFYKHYVYREDLLNEILKDVIDDLIFAYRVPYQHYRDFGIMDLSASAIKIFDHVLGHATFYALLVNTNMLTGFRNTLYETLKTLYLEDVTDMSPDPRVNKELLACYQANAVLGLITGWVQSNFKYSASYMAEQLLEFTRMNRSNEVYRSNLNPTSDTLETERGTVSHDN
ncbi:TetR/AcrR family transcriptional regulator C-terminal domain-containing protein [Paenibacillus sp. FSL K6-0108]|uniref:TetR/AcrR family transcriptional regulator n=1 Tax=Paenibacillus sp. FSL K6-0108 TaxID=2921417 RepID=UPI0032434360